MKLTERTYTVSVTTDIKERLRLYQDAMGDSVDFGKLAELMDQFGPEEHPEDPKERKRQRILRVATELFVHHGYRKTSMSDVAQAAQVAKGTVYLYFKNKAELLMQAISDEKIRYARRLQPLLTAPLPPADKLKLWLRIALMMTAEVPLLARLLSGDQELLAVLEDADEVLGVRTMELQLGFITTLLQEAIDGSDWTEEMVQDRARVLLSVVYQASSVADARMRFGLSVEQYATYLAEILVDGIGAEASPHDTPSTPSGGAP